MKFIVNSVFVISCALLFVACGTTKKKNQEENQAMEVKQKVDQVLVFTKTAGWRHKSIEKGVETLKELGAENSFQVFQTEDSLDFNSTNLNKYKLVVFLNTTLNILDEKQQGVFEKYIQSGGSFMGIHAACDTEYEWPWFGKLVGAYFNGHPNNPNVRDAVINVVDKKHPATMHLNDTWARTDEWYNYKEINPDIHVIMELDENSYEGGTNGDNHPIAWYHEFDGGRSFYTGGGHTKETFDEPDFRKHLVGGLLYCLRR
ncbi:ThuA domain-containing protein [uncultured Maribacter sp.]|uniref:ThuA domain-containing protein n=1 Tax=uncultured Maribacter sp. TaxID=431308 RepID=UPI002621BFA6|nr:ThuA domain-containing protein [uncultured Maribacter sp.]